jgi:hypothetical protein
MHWVPDSLIPALQGALEKFGICHREVDDAFQLAETQLQVLETRITNLAHALDALSHEIPSACESSHQLSCFLNTASGGSAASAALETFSGRTVLLANQWFSDLMLPEFTVVQARLAELKALREKHERKRREWAAKANSLSGIEGCDPATVGQLRIEVQRVRTELDALATQIKEGAAALWDERFGIIERQMVRLVGIAFKFSEETFGNLQELEASIDPELLRQDFA